ncbi:recombinase family protein [Providencia sp. PROV038]|uniref:Recombinase domain-containing protein n=1 Tax=Providencia stuartii TaxID=588 RepID=A0A1S1HTP8_PROST|nr:recombinase family protein [Providencia sp. PROV038]OHT25357.1 hypothetical protein A3Q29_13680 [Providencia stuartii]
MSKLKAHVYTRISKASQQEGSGLHEQRERIDEYIKKHTKIFDDKVTYWKDIGKSAYKGKNIQYGEIAEFIKQVKSGLIGKGHALILYSLDRFSRRSSWDEDILQWLVKNDIEIHDVTTPVVLKKDDPWSKTIMDLILLRGHNESEIKSERSKAGWKKRLDDTRNEGKVFTNKLPSWLSTDENGYIIIEDKVEVIKRLFRDYLSGLSSTMIARRLNEEGIESMAGSLWRPNGVTKLIKDERLRGTLRRSNNQESIPNIFPVIIDEDLFNNANRMLNINAAGIKGRPRENNKTREVNNILTGIVRCGKCGAKVTTAKNGRSVKYVVCLNRRNHEICRQRSIRLRELETIIIRHTKQMDMSKVFSFHKEDKTHENKLKMELMYLNKEEKKFKEKISERKKLGKTVNYILAESLTDIQDKIDEVRLELSQISIIEPIPTLEKIEIEELIDVSNIDLRMSLRKYLTQTVDEIRFRSIEEKFLIEIIYYNNVYKHILITDKKVNVIEHEISIEKEEDKIIYSTNEFKLCVNETTQECNFKGLELVKIQDYFLLINYISGLGDKQWVINEMYKNENIVYSNGL